MHRRDASNTYPTWNEHCAKLYRELVQADSNGKLKVESLKYFLVHTLLPRVEERQEERQERGPKTMHLFMKAAKGWGPFGRKLRRVRSPDGVKEMIEKVITM